MFSMSPLDLPVATVSPPTISSLDRILPAEPLLLMGAGPVPIPHAVARANGVVINHLGETMDRVIHQLKAMARYAFQTQSDKVLGVGGPASAAMEMAISNLLWPGRSALILKTGTFSGRLGEMAQGVGADIEVLAPEKIGPVDLEQVEAALKLRKFDVVTMVQGETSCGVENDVHAVAKLAKQYGALLIVDAVVTVGTMPMYMDAWGVDVAITGGQKGLASIPGVSLIAFSTRAWECLSSRTAPRQHWCLDAVRAQRFWGEQQYHYTAPVPGILALHESLRLLCEEGLEARYLRHMASSKALQAGLSAMGLGLFIPEAHRLNSVVAISTPSQVRGDVIRSKMAVEYGVEISGAFGLDIIRIGQMGEQCRVNNVYRTLHALGMTCDALGVPLDLAAGLVEFSSKLAAARQRL